MLLLLTENIKAVIEKKTQNISPARWATQGVTDKEFQYRTMSLYNLVCPYHLSAAGILLMLVQSKQTFYAFNIVE